VKKSYPTRAAYFDVGPMHYEFEAVPSRIQRIDCGNTHGWQVRWKGTMLFSDNQYGGPYRSLDSATKELMARLKANPPERRIRTTPQPNKKDKRLPVGVYGPFLVRRKGRVDYAEFKVFAPANTPRGFRLSTVYIGTRNTYSRTRVIEALAKAVDRREQMLKALGV
jgi:hypothetical protein